MTGDDEIYLFFGEYSLSDFKMFKLDQKICLQASKFMWA